MLSRMSCGRVGLFAALVVCAVVIATGDAHGSQRLVSTSGPYVSDTFDRAVTTGWGTADLGGGYAYRGDIAPFSVVGRSGLVTVAHGERAEATLPHVSAVNVDAAMTFALSGRPSQGRLTTGLVLRSAGAGALPTEFRAVVAVDPEGNVTAVWRRVVDGRPEQLAAQRLRLNVVHETAYVLRARVVGVEPTRLALKLWPASSKQPAAWSLVTTDTTPALQQAGAVGLRVGESSTQAATVVLHVKHLRGGHVPLVADTTPPAAPSELSVSGVTQTGFAAAWAASTDNVGVAGYRIFLDGREVAAQPATGFAFAVACGTLHTIGVEAFDAAGNTSQVASVQATSDACTPAPDTTPPTVSWIAPTSGSTVSGRLNDAAGNCVVDATDNDAVARVEFLLDGHPLNTDFTAPYGCSWDTVTAASGTSHTLKAIAYDAATNSAESSVSVTVDNGQVLWHAGGEQAIADEWAEYSTAPHCAVTSDTVTSDARVARVTAPVAQGQYSYGFVVNDGDNCYGERAELGQALPSRAGFTESHLFNPGNDRWISFQVYLGNDFPVGTGDWNVIAQWKQLVSSSVVTIPMLALQVHDGAFYLERAPGAASADMHTVSTRLATATTGRWVQMSLHIVFSADPTVGLVEVYGDPDGGGMRQLMAVQHFSTLTVDAAGNAVPSHSRIGIYRNPSISGTAHLYYDGYTVATSRAAAEAAAFS